MNSPRDRRGLVIEEDDGVLELGWWETEDVGATWHCVATIPEVAVSVRRRGLIAQHESLARPSRFRPFRATI
jgi:hypothetical protein